MTTVPNRRGAVYCSVVGLREPKAVVEHTSWRTGPTPWALLVAGIVLVVDLNLSLGYGISALYAMPVLVASLAGSRGVVLAVAAVSSVMVVVGLMF